MNKPIYLGLCILEISKIIMYEFWYDFVKNKYGNKARLYYTDTDSFVINIKTNDFYKDISQDVNESLIIRIILLIDHYLKERIKR